MSRRSENLQELFATSAVIQRMMYSLMHRAIEDLGIAPSQLQLMQLIEQRQPVSLKTLAADMRLTPGAITQLVDGLVQVGYARRTPASIDRRVTMAELTKDGTSKIGLCKRRKQALLMKAVDYLDDDELAVYLKVQQKILDHLEQEHKSLKGKKEHQRK